MLENELRDSARQFARAENFSGGNGWSPINDIGRYTVLESSLPVAVRLLAEVGEAAESGYGEFEKWRLVYVRD
jgi:hypothetical protein